MRTVAVLSAPRSRLGLPGLAAVLLAVGLHVVVDLPVPGSLSVRLGAADLVLPLVLALAAWQWHAAGRPTLEWLLPSLWRWLAAISAVMTIALAVGGIRLGHLTSWALVNKYLGWYVLLGYLLAGALLRVLLRPEAQTALLRWLLAGAAVGCLWSIGLREAINLGLVGVVPYPQATPWQEVLGLVWSRYRMSGFLVNSNTFGFVLGGLALVQLPLIKRGLVFSPRWHQVVLTLMLACIPYSGGRAAIAGFLAGFLLLAVLRQVPWRMVALAAAGAAALVIAMHALPELAKPAGGGARSLSVAALAPNVDNPKSVHARVGGYERALSVWATAPVTGVGLGGFVADQAARGEQPVQVIHNTWLWFLVETGPAGLAVVALFVAALCRALWPSRQEPLQAGLLGLLALTAVFSLAHEVMYQRLIWLVIGMALVRAPTPTPTPTSTLARAGMDGAR